MRKIHPDVIAAMRSRSVRIAVMAELDHPAGYVRVWTGVGTLHHNGHDWTGIGWLGRITGMRQVSELEIVDHAYQLTHVPPDYEQFVNAKVRGGPATAYLAFVDDARQVIGDPIVLGRSTMDTSQWSIGDDGVATLTITGQSDLWQLEQPLNISLSDTEQRKRFPTDTGFSYVTTVTNQKIKWTRV